VVAAVFGLREVRQHGVPDEGAFRKAVQEQQHRPAGGAALVALQGGAVG